MLTKALTVTEECVNTQLFYFCAEEIPSELSFLLSSYHFIVFEPPSVCMHSNTYIFAHALTRHRTALKSKSNCCESHCHRGNSGRLHTQHSLSYLFFSSPPLHHTDHRYKQLPDITLLLHADVQLPRGKFTIYGNKCA